MPIDKRFKLLALRVLLKLLNNFIDCPELIKRLNFKINFLRSRYKPVFYLPSISKNYFSLSSNNLMSTTNRTNNIDFFHATLLDLSK